MTEEEYQKAIAALAVKAKKVNDDSKRREILEIKKLKNPSPEQRSMMKSHEEALANDTSTMFDTREGFGRRIGRDGRPVGPELEKIGGRYKEVQKKAKGGAVKKMRSGGACGMKGGGKIRGGGCETRGKTRGRFV